MTRVLALLASLALLAWFLFHAWVIMHLVRSEVMPALAAGSFSIQTNSTILNRVWEGNELYWLIGAHAILMAILGAAMTMSVRFAIRGRRRTKRVRA